MGNSPLEKPPKAPIPGATSSEQQLPKADECGPIPSTSETERSSESWTHVEAEAWLAGLILGDQSADLVQEFVDMGDLTDALRFAVIAVLRCWWQGPAGYHAEWKWRH